MTEKTIKRKCNNCKTERRTTVHPDEEKEYICEQCYKSIAKTALKESSPTKGFVIAVIIFITGMFVEWALLKFVF